MIPLRAPAIQLLIVPALLFVLSSPAIGIQTATLKSADTILVVSAGAGNPAVVSLGSSGGAVWKAHRPELLIDKVQIDGDWQPVRWKLESPKRYDAGKSIAFIYASPKPRLRLRWEWRARASGGPLEHRIIIENLEGRIVGLPLQDSFSFDWIVPASEQLRQMWIEKGADKPSAEGTHDLAVTSSYQWEGTSSTYAHDRPGEPREIIPWMLVQKTEDEQPGWYVGIEFSGRVRLTLSRDGTSLAGRVGLDPSPGPYLTWVPAGKSFVTPTVFLGAFRGGSEGAGNVLRRWVAQVLLNSSDLRNPAYPLLVNNSWGSGMEINEEKARSMVDDAAKLGIEMFHLDAGWFRGVADWQPNPQKFPDGIGVLADYAHRAGLKFGLWVDWTQAGASTEPSALNVHDPKIRDWLTREVAADWKPEPFKGITLDIGYQPARVWCAKELARLVKDYHLDMLEHDGYLVAQGCIRADHPHASCERSRLGPEPYLEGECSTDVSYHAARAYYGLYEGLRHKYPHLLLEACNDGGRMVDFGTAAHTDYFSITDAYDPLSNRRAFYDASHVLPAAMLECYVERYPSPHMDNFLYMLRSGMMGWCTIMQDTTVWTPEQRAAARQVFQVYKTRLRPLIRHADLYHISPRPDGLNWDGLEYFDRQKRQGVVYAFRGSTPQEREHAFSLRGLIPDRQYELHFEDHTSPDREISGRELMRSGLTVSLRLPESSELVFITEKRRQ